jgi:hypothetical protein
MKEEGQQCDFNDLDSVEEGKKWPEYRQIQQEEFEFLIDEPN